jgi:hypothetical protein
VSVCTESSLFFNYCLIDIGQSYVLRFFVFSGVVLQLAHCIVSLKNWTAASMSTSVLRETFKVNLSLTRRPSHPNLHVYCLSLVISLGSLHVLLE